jgi:tRNA modification GTPase
LQHVRDVCLSQIHRLTDLINTAHEGRIMREGLKAVICGKPNVGKSSLLNALLRYERAIVTDIPGTTRDVIEEVVNIKGIPLVLLDTAGIRKADNLVERLGIEQSISSVENADIVLFMIDINSEIDGNDLKIAELLKGKNVIIVANKVDLEEVADIHRFTDILGETRIIKISVLRGTGLDLLEQEIHSMALGEGLSGGDSVVISNVRHKNGLEQAKNNLVSALEALDSGIPLDLVLIDIREAAMQLGTITGEHISEDIIDSLFRDFCIGK